MFQGERVATRGRTYEARGSLSKEGSGSTHTVWKSKVMRGEFRAS